MTEDLVCVLCGVPWDPPVANQCPNPERDGFCSWGPAKDADLSSWVATDQGWVPRPPLQEES